MKVLAALSGGVDSAVAAARVAEAGHEVTAVHMALLRSRSFERTGRGGCCSIEDAGDARRAADILNLPFYVWDLSEDFQATVMADFLAEYAAGRTPNPCIRCNQHIKFATLMRRADTLGFDAVCTGHYARVVNGPDGPQLRRALAADKDQSYVLAVMGRAALSRVLLPLGQAASKAEVRAEAAARGLALADKPDSQDICFIPDGDTAGFLRSQLGEQPGQIRDQTGAVVGHHRGAYAYTIGQRRGLHLPGPAADGEPRYVTDLDVVGRTVTVGPAAALAVTDFEAHDMVWLADRPSGPINCSVQVRAHGAPLAARIVPAEPGPGRVAGPDGRVGGPDGPVVPSPDRSVAGRLAVYLAEPVRALASGQSAVFYDGDRVLAQGTIRR